MIGLRISTTSVVRKSFLEPSPISECTPHDNGSLSLDGNIPRLFGDLGERRGDKPARKLFGSVISLHQSDRTKGKFVRADAFLRSFSAL